jgi:lambda family phage portal protein
VKLFGWPRASTVSIATPADVGLDPQGQPLYADAPRAQPARTGRRMYHSARPSRLTAGWQSTQSSADAEISSSLTLLRGRSRALMRDSPYAKRARRLIVNNVIGSGMGLQAQVKNTRGEMLKRANDGIEEAFSCWSRADYCHTGGGMAFGDFERALLAQVVETGEVFVRQHYRPFGGSPIPYALELIESERVPHENLIALGVGESLGLNATEMRLGVEVDQFYRAVAYWIRDRHPSDYPYPSTVKNLVQRVPADEIIHLRLIDRWPQTRGVPWLHAIARALNDMEGYEEAELVAARGAANYLGWLEQSDLDDPDVEQQDDGSFETELSPGIIGRGPPGSKIQFNNPNRPNSALDPFMRFMLRKIAAGLDVSYASLSRDYSQSNYSSSRLDLLDDRDVWRSLQTWWQRAFRCQVHSRWLQQAVLAGEVDGVPVEEYGVDPEKFEAAKFKARGWSWIDPTKEVQAFKEAVRCGFTTRTAVIAQTNNGDDIEDVDLERAGELAAQKELDPELVYDVDPGVNPTDAGAKPTTPITESEQGTADAADAGPDAASSDAASSQSGRMRVVR